MQWTVLGHFGAVCLMGLIVLSSQTLTRRMQRGRMRTEARRLRDCLLISFQALRVLHEENLVVLGGGRPPLMSARHQIHLLRTQLGRLHTLEQSEVEAVMSACVALERLESILALAGKSVTGVSFTLPKSEEDRRVLHLALRQTCALLETAEGRLRETQGGADAGMDARRPASDSAQLPDARRPSDLTESVPH